MKLHQYFLMFLVLLVSFQLIGNMVLSPTINYNVTPSNNLTNMLTGKNYTEFENKINQIADSSEAGGDGFLAQYQTANLVWETTKETTSQAGSLIGSISGFIGLPQELTTLIIVILAILVVFAGIYLIVGRS